MYMYAGNDPLNGVDPSGQCIIDVSNDSTCDSEPEDDKTEKAIIRMQMGDVFSNFDSGSISEIGLLPSKGGSTKSKFRLLSGFGPLQLIGKGPFDKPGPKAIGPLNGPKGWFRSPRITTPRNGQVLGIVNRLGHIRGRHGFRSPNQSGGRFIDRLSHNEGLGNVINQTYRLGSVRPNTNGRDGFIFEYDFGVQTGWNTAGNVTSKVRVIVDQDGFLTSAFPF